MKEALTGRELGLTAVRGRPLNAKEVANVIGMSERWVHKQMWQGTFPVRWFLIGERGRFVDSADLNEWLGKTAIEAGTAPLPVKAERKLRRKKGVIAQ